MTPSIRQTLLKQIELLKEGLERQRAYILLSLVDYHSDWVYAYEGKDGLIFQLRNDLPDEAYEKLGGRDINSVLKYQHDKIANSNFQGDSTSMMPMASGWGFNVGPWGILYMVDKNHHVAFFHVDKVQQKYILEMLPAWDDLDDGVGLENDIPKYLKLALLKFKKLLEINSAKMINEGGIGNGGYLLQDAGDLSQTSANQSPDTVIKFQAMPGYDYHSMTGISDYNGLKKELLKSSLMYNGHRAPLSPTDDLLPDQPGEYSKSDDKI